LAVLALVILLTAALAAVWLAMTFEGLDSRAVLAAFSRLAAGLLILTAFLILLPAYADHSLKRRQIEIFEGIRDGREIPESSWDYLAPQLNAFVRSRKALSVEVERLRIDAERNRHLAAMGEIVSGIVHEIRTPLTNIIGYAPLAKEDCGERQVGQDVEKIIESAKRCERVTDSLLSFSRVRTPSFESVRLGDLVAFSGGSAAGVAITCDFPDGASAIEADSNLLSIALRNLISNSIDAGARTIRFASERDGSSVRIFCRDDGSGIPAAVSGAVFEAFKSSKKGGLGLGMALTRSIVDAHGDPRAKPAGRRS
jgi:signal transduction histidine kinase